MKKWLEKYFGRSKGEFNGLLLLAALIVLLKLLPKVYGLWQDEYQASPGESAALYTLSLSDSSAVVVPVNETPEQGRKQDNASRLFYFDPNTIGTEDWQALGFSPRQAAAVMKYVAKGGRFRKVEDLKKMYTITAQRYLELAPYVRIKLASSEIGTPQDRGRYENHRPQTAVNVPPVRVVALNIADSTVLESLRGIGPAFARRIIRYRERLGGFYALSQLLEVYGLDSAKYEEIKGQFSIQVEGLRKIKVNTVVFEDLKSHPYLRYKQVNALIEYRKQHGNYSNIADLYKVANLNAETIERLAPYLIFE